MNLPKVSVIVPTYVGSDYLGEAIQSVLDQTYPHFELIIVNDQSPDDTDAIVAQFDDQRLIYLVHEYNKGVDHARKSGLAVSSGEIIAFLDQDDFFHPEKLAAHVNFLKNNPDIGITFNPYFNLNHSSITIRDIFCPPVELTLADLVFGFPLPPSVMVVKRDWAFRDELWEEKTFLRGREIVFCGRLFMAGCKFAMVNRILNYRRYHTGRVFNDIVKKCADERACQELIFTDDRYPKNLLAQRDLASANIYLMWAYVAFAQQETKLGQEFVKNAISLNPKLLQGSPSDLTKFFLMYAIDEENFSHKTLLINLFEQFPVELSSILDQCEWAIGQGDLLKGIRSVMWGRFENGRLHFGKALNKGAQIDTFTMQVLTNQLMYYEAEFGVEAARIVTQDLIQYLKSFGDPRSIRVFKGNYSVNRAFRNYNDKQYREVPKDVFQAIKTDPKYITNRGVLSVLVRSSINMWKTPKSV